MRTLVVSDLHLGTPSGTDLLTRRPAALHALAEAVADVDRLVLLGDVLELRGATQRASLAAASPVLARLGAALGAGRELLVLAGNHDHRVLADGLDRALREGGPPLGSERVMAPEEAGGLAVALADAVRAGGPVAVRFAYPGAWLREDVYALHGHYLDAHSLVPTVERLFAGALYRRVGRVAADRARREGADRAAFSVAAYEAALAPLYAFLGALGERTAAAPSAVPAARASASERVWIALEQAGPLRGGALRSGLALATRAMTAAGAGELHGELNSDALRRGTLHGIREVLRDLGIDAPHVLFGHTHRAGPRAGDDLAEWTTHAGGRLRNTGSWVRQDHFLRPDPTTSPYFPGTAVLVGESGPPEHLDLLRDTPGAVL